MESPSHLGQRPGPLSNPGSSSFTVIIPTHQRREAVVATLGALGEQAADCAVPIALVVIVDGSDDGTAQAVRALQLPMPLHVIEQHRAGVAAARNRGAAAATGEWILFLDDDIVVQPGYLAAILDAAREDVDIVLTRLVVGDWVSDSLLSREARAWDSDEHAALEHGRTRHDDINFASTAIRRPVFEEAGGFDESFTAGGMYGNEDVELGHRLLEAGARVRYCPDAMAHTDVIVDADLAMRREYQVGINDVAMVGKHPDLGEIRFGNRFRYSRIDRVLAPLMLYLPITLAVMAPLRALVRWLLQRKANGTAAYRIWFTVRAMHYWGGVRVGGGRDMVNEVRHRRG